MSDKSSPTGQVKQSELVTTDSVKSAVAVTSAFKLTAIVLSIVTILFLALALNIPTYFLVSLVSGSLLLLVLVSFSKIAQKWLILVSSLSGGVLFALFLAGLIGNDGKVEGIHTPLQWMTADPEFLLLCIFGWFGGIIYTIVSDNNIELPTASIRGENISPGIIGDVLIGISGALLAYQFLPDIWQDSAGHMAVAGVVGGYGGKVIIAAVFKKFIDRINETSLEEAQRKNQELSEENQQLKTERTQSIADRAAIDEVKSTLEATQAQIEQIKPYDFAAVERELQSMSLNDAETVLKTQIVDAQDVAELPPVPEAAVRLTLGQLNGQAVGQSQADLVTAWVAFKTDRHQRNPHLIGQGSVKNLLDGLAEKEVPPAKQGSSLNATGSNTAIASAITNLPTTDRPKHSSASRSIDGIPSRVVELIEKHEGFRANAYPDPAHGWQVPTIGYGTTTYPDGRKVKQGDTVTREQAQQYLMDFLLQKCRPILAKIPTWSQMNVNQQGALYSFAYNLGPGFYRAANRESITRLCDSPTLWTNKAEVTRIFELYCNPNAPNVTAGLKRRRGEEAALFCTPVNATSERPNPLSQKSSPMQATASASTVAGSNKQLLKLDVKYYSQLDNATDVFGPGSRQCCTSSNAMLLNYLLDGELDVLALQRSQSQAESVYDDFVARYGDTTNHDAQTKALNDFGVNSYWSTSLSQEFLLKSLKANVPVVIGVLYKRSGHIVVVVGHDPAQSGFLIHDPYGTRQGTSNRYAIGQGGEYDLYTYSTLKTLFDPKKNGWGRVVTSVKGTPTGLE
ncbi:MAG: C39 family peptidase [Synechococcus sp.]